MLVRPTFQPECDLHCGTSRGDLVIFKKDDPIADIPQTDFEAWVEAGIKVEAVPPADHVTIGTDAAEVTVKPAPPARRTSTKRT